MQKEETLEDLMNMGALDTNPEKNTYEQFKTYYDPKAAQPQLLQPQPGPMISQQNPMMNQSPAFTFATAFPQQMPF